MHFRQFQPENFDAKCILLAAGNWLSLTVKVVKLVFQNNHSDLFMTGPWIALFKEILF